MKKAKKYAALCLLLASVPAFSGCQSKDTKPETKQEVQQETKQETKSDTQQDQQSNPDTIGDYRTITAAEAAKLMQAADQPVIVDVRTAAEYADGHIPGAILVPNESITDQAPQQLPDREKLLLVYCRSGRRSKEASQKLAKLGYQRVYDFGGIINWTGDIVNGTEPGGK